MYRHQYDTGSGTLLELVYEVDPRDGAVVFSSCHVTGANYGLVGPDMLDFLHRLAFVNGTNAQPVLSVIAEEIMNADRI